MNKLNKLRGLIQFNKEAKRLKSFLETFTRVNNITYQGFKIISEIDEHEGFKLNVDVDISNEILCSHNKEKLDHINWYIDNFILTHENDSDVYAYFTDKFQQLHIDNETLNSIDI